VLEQAFREDWGRVITGSPVVEMNRAIAVAELEGPHAALAVLDRLALDDCRYHQERRFLESRLAQLDNGTEPGPDL
jgi:RNA polymerase sigma-70 factor (ECF subfamily)